MGDGDGDSFLDSLTDSNLYSIGAYFQDSHPELADEVVAQAETIESTGLARYAEREGLTIETAFQTLVTGLAVRYHRAVSA